MLVLIRILPFLVGGKIPENEDHWLCFILLKKILDIVLCPNLTKNLCASLKLLIKEHHDLFVWANSLDSQNAFLDTLS